MEVYSDETVEKRLQYLKHFDPKDFKDEFLPQCYSDREYLIDNYYDAFSNHVFKDDKTKKSFLDFGCGPAVTSSGVAAAAAMTEGASLDIHMSDFLPKNRQAVMDWISAKEDSMDWQSFFEYIAKISKLNVDEVVNCTRKSFVQVTDYDLFEKEWSNLPRHDVVMSSYCIECAAATAEEYKTFLKKVLSLVNENGYFLLIHCLNCSYYKVGGQKFKCVGSLIQEEDINAVLIGDGFKILRRDFSVRESDWVDHSDKSGVLYFFAKRE